ncbi:tRNA pseudouridine synthase A isoform X3 [Drosophila subobscura]|uniref:tRNA pseudouridine synthase A isoform X3 n=1 Tax=Drosophila subobscura TaxID=7241 RepID=UPI00155B3E35|nr:tRNA pseudouridine synthase A isoform X3 [Drosophila subobscura]
MLFNHILSSYTKAVRLKTLLLTESKHCHRYKSFAAAMSEALDKLELDNAAKKAAKAVEDEAVKDANRIKRNLKRKKWVDWKTQDDEEAANGTKRAPFDPADRIKRKKSAILLSYCGANYYGMQRNPGMQTIEEELFKAMLKHKWITEDSYDQAQIACFQRAARTDKGVSAARQICSVKLPEELDLEAFNADLPEQIRLFGVERVTKGFNAKDQCNARTYTYTLPTVAFAPCEAESEQETFRIEPELLEKVKETLKLYEGTKNFHNFTSKKLKLFGSLGQALHYVLYKQRALSESTGRGVCHAKGQRPELHVASNQKNGWPGHCHCAGQHDGRHAGEGTDRGASGSAHGPWPWPGPGHCPLRALQRTLWQGWHTQPADMGGAGDAGTGLR